MFTNNFDPVAFNFFIFDIRWYSLSYILGILFGWIYIKKIYLTDSSSEDLFDKYISYLIIGIIIGGRLGYVFLYDFNYLINEHEKIISNKIKKKPVKNLLFNDFEGSIKSLGAWGGDFVLASSENNSKNYFKRKGFETSFSFDEIIT